MYGPDCPTACVNLVDALRDYIRAEEDLADDLSSDGAISREQFKGHGAWLQPARLLLKDLEAREFNPTLSGLLHER